MVIRMLNELRGSVDELSENFNKDIKNIKMEMEIIKENQSEMKTILSEIKSILEGINRVDEVEGRISDAEDGVAEDTQSEWRQEKRNQKYENNLRSLWDKVKCNNVRIIGVPEGEDRNQEVENLFEEMIMENFPNLVKEIDIQP